MGQRQDKSIFLYISSPTLELGSDAYMLASAMLLAPPLLKDPRHSPQPQVTRIGPTCQVTAAAHPHGISATRSHHSLRHHALLSHDWIPKHLDRSRNFVTTSETSTQFNLQALRTCYRTDSARCMEVKTVSKRQSSQSQESYQLGIKNMYTENALKDT